MKASQMTKLHMVLKLSDIDAMEIIKHKSLNNEKAYKK